MVKWWQCLGSDCKQELFSSRWRHVSNRVYYQRFVWVFAAGEHELVDEIRS